MSETNKKNSETNSKEEVKMEKAVEKEVSHAEKKKLRRAAMDDSSGLYLDEKYKRPGYRQRLVNVLEGNVHKREQEGYNIIEISEAQYGNGSVDTAHSTTGGLEVEVGRKRSMKAVWMEISEEDALILDEIRDDKAREQAAMIYKSDIPEDVRIGKVSREE